MKQIILVTGAARSGKSEWAEILAGDSGKKVVYVATAQVDETDLEWQGRIAKHRRRRDPSWQILTVPTALPTTIEASLAHTCLLVDSLGSWVANLLSLEENSWQEREDQLLASLQTAGADIIVVAEETGWGVVPAYASGRKFRDRLGAIIRRIGAVANPVYLVAGGHVLNLSLLGKPLNQSTKNKQQSLDIMNTMIENSSQNL